VPFQSFHRLALLAVLGCGSTAPAPVPSGDLDVLFIGNSLTSTNDIPGLVSELGTLTDGPRVRASVVAFGNYNLQDHWIRGDALDSIARGRWDYVVMQQGPSTQPESRQHLVEWAGRFAEPIRAAGGQPVIYMVWPSNGDFDGVSRSYTEAAVAVDGTLVPAGEAFRAVVRDHPDIEVFAADDFHPSRIGSYLAALVIYGRLTDQSVQGVTLRRPVPGLTSAQAGRLESAADQANRDFGID
jgi:hypothetical protein